ncbi:endolytic transglycosylase MltG [Candidatus Peregrinibacteria bacterium]|nr:endolytic transglycosylase MltG [Candidatus Peregrinibacteria bacterium]
MKRHSSLMRRFLMTCILALLLVGGYVWYTVYTPINTQTPQEASLVIKRGTSPKQVGTMLKDNNIIRSALSFYGYVRLTGEDKNITAGRFTVNQSMSIPDIVHELTVPVASEAAVTIQEGLTVRDIDATLTKQGLITSGEFEQAVQQFDNYDSYPFIDRAIAHTLEFPLEGYLYPDTYFVDGIEFNPHELIEKMLDNFENKFDSVQNVFDAQDRSMHDIITMASILQKEVRTPEDYNIVSGLLWKRLDSNWHIGADATILYITGKNTISAEDLKLDSPYNTRLHVGMPPGPICNPDIEHIKAAITPEDSDYWYYLTTLDTGEVIYATTNEEHNANKARYLY